MEFENFEEKIEYLKNNPEKLRKALELLYDDLPEMAIEFADLAIIGKHLTSETLEKAINGMEFVNNINPLTITQSNDIAKSLGITFDKFNKYDYNFMMNWFLSDMTEIWGTDTIKYGKYAYFMLAKDPDYDYPEERAYKEARKFIKRYEANN